MVLIHGILSQYSGGHSLAASWVPALRDGLARASADHLLGSDEVACVFYGDIFRGEERVLGTEPSGYDSAELMDPYERQLLWLLWAGAVEADPAMVPPGERTLSAVASVQAVLVALAGSRFLATVTERMLIYWLRQVRRYFTEPDLRARIQSRFAGAVSADTRIVVAHSLGSVIAYEALCAHPQWNVRALVTLGSPLGIPNLIRDRLQPRPVVDEGRIRGSWPGQVTDWTNVADRGDFVALVKKLSTVFGDRVVDIEVDTGLRAHQVQRYLTTHATGHAVARALRHE